MSESKRSPAGTHRVSVWVIESGMGISSGKRSQELPRREMLRWEELREWACIVEDIDEQGEWESGKGLLKEARGM